MDLTEKQKEVFKKLAKPLIKFLCENSHPHTTILITPTSAELLESAVAIQTEEFVLD